MSGKSSIGFSGFEKLTFLVEISKFSEISRICENFERGAPALRVIRAGTRLTVHRSLLYSSFSKSNSETVLSRADLGPHKMMNYRPKMIELTRFCSMKHMNSQRKPCRAYVED